MTDERCRGLFEYQLDRAVDGTWFTGFCRRPAGHEGEHSAERSAEEQRYFWSVDVAAERNYANEKGFTAEHDAEHGLDHLLMWADEYLYRGEMMKAAGLIQAARELVMKQQNDV